MMTDDPFPPELRGDENHARVLRLFRELLAANPEADARLLAEGLTFFLRGARVVAEARRHQAQLENLARIVASAADSLEKAQAGAIAQIVGASCRRN
jgi:hypothetical protein